MALNLVGCAAATKLGLFLPHLLFSSGFTLCPPSCLHFRAFSYCEAGSPYRTLQNVNSLYFPFSLTTLRNQNSAFYLSDCTHCRYLSYECNLTMFALSCLFYEGQLLISIHVQHVLGSHFYFLLTNIPLCVYIMFCLFILFLADSWVASTTWLVSIAQLQRTGICVSGWVSVSVLLPLYVSVIHGSYGNSVFNLLLLGIKPRTLHM